MTNLEWLRAATSEQIKAWLDEEVDASKDVSTGWVKLKAPNGTIYIKTSGIVGLAPIPPDAPFAMDGIITKVFTRYDESAAWLVCDTVDEIIEKIKKA